MASILIADDDEANRALMQFVLQAQGGHQVTETSNAAAAAQVMEAVDPDLVVLDVMMPGISGLEFSRTLRRKGGPPILMVSGLGGVEDRITGLRSGADDYLPKPFDPAEFLERVNALLRRARRIQLDPTGATVRAGHHRHRVPPPLRHDDAPGSGLDARGAAWSAVGHRCRSGGRGR